MRSHTILLTAFAVLAAAQTRTQTQNTTITTPPLTTTSDSYGYLGCYNSSTGACLTASYIQQSCLVQYTFVDDLWGCLCSNTYDQAWSRCSSCKASFNYMGGNFQSTDAFVTNCSSILSVLATAMTDTTVTTTVPTSSVGGNTQQTPSRTAALGGGPSSTGIASAVHALSISPIILLVTIAITLPALYT